MPEFSLQAWPNANFKGDYHNLHNHPHSWLSENFGYLHVPDQSQAETFRSDFLNPASISFFDPRGAANMTAIRNDGQFDLNIGAPRVRASCFYGHHFCIIWYIPIWLTSRAYQFRSMLCYPRQQSISEPSSLATGCSNRQQASYDRTHRLSASGTTKRQDQL